MCKNTRYSTKNGDRRVLGDTVKPLPENILSLETNVPGIPKKFKITGSKWGNVWWFCSHHFNGSAIGSMFFSFK